MILGHPGDGVVEDQEQHGADHRPEERGDAAEHVDEDALARNGPVGEFRIGAGDEQRHDDAADRGEQRRQHEDRQLGAPDVDADEAGPRGVVADHAQRVAERRLHDLAHQEQADHQQRAADDVEMQMVRQIDAEKWRPRNAAAQALIAAGQRHPGQDGRVDQHLERQRHEGEIDLLQPHADRADDEARRQT